MFIEIVSGCCWDTPLEVVTLSLPWPPLEVGGGTVVDPMLAVVQLVWGVVTIWEIQVVGILLFTNFQRLFGQLQLPLVVDCIFWWGHLVVTHVTVLHK